MNHTHPKLHDNIRSLINLAKKIDTDDYDGDWCAMNKATADSNAGCLVHHMLWSPTNTNRVLRQYASDLKKNFNLTKNTSLELFDLFHDQTFISITDFYFGKGMAVYFTAPGDSLSQVIVDLNHMLVKLGAANAAPREDDRRETPANDTVTITRGAISVNIDANDPKVKELLAYLSGMLV